MLVLMPESPFPWASTASRYYGPLVKALDAIGHEVQVLCVRNGARGPDEPAAYFDGTSIRFTFVDAPGARPALERKLRSAWRGEWELAASSFGREARLLASRGVNVVLAEHPSTGRAVEGLRNAVCSLHCLRHVDLRSGTSLSDRRRSLFVRRAERMTLERIGRARVVTPRLAELARTLVPGIRVSVVPLCIDSSLYEPLEPPPAPTVGFIGSMFWEPSRAAARRFVERVTPLVRREMPDARFLVAGWDAGRYLGAAAHAAGVQLIENFRDPRDVFAQLSVLVNAPPVGTGMKIKVLEAMACGVPVVANDDGAEGLDWDKGAPITRAQTDEDIAAAVLSLLRDDVRRRKVAADGRVSVERSFAPRTVASRLVVELMRLVSTSAAAVVAVRLLPMLTRF
jgi:glycosyltransferase involved in cell wall biosynthesis